MYQSLCRNVTKKAPKLKQFLFSSAQFLWILVLLKCREGLSSQHSGWRLSEELQIRARVLALQSQSQLWVIHTSQLRSIPDNISPFHYFKWKLQLSQIPQPKVMRPFLLNVSLNSVPETSVCIIHVNIPPKFCAMKGKVQQINMQ